MGMSTGGTNAISRPVVHQAIATPSAPATIDSTSASVSSCRIRRPRPAPRDRRMAISRRRPTALDSSRLATLAHARISTSDTTTESTMRIGASTVGAPKLASRGGTTATRQPSSMPGFSRSIALRMADASACACSRETPGLSRARVCIQPLPLAPVLSRPHRSRCIIIGAQADAAAPRNDPMKPSCATPMTVIGVLLTTTSRPMTEGSPEKRRCQ